MIQLDLSILNQKGTPMFNSDIFANRPPFGIVGRIFISTDTSQIFRDTGTSYVLISDTSAGGTITGSGTTGTLPLWSGSTSLGNSTLIEGATKITTTKDFQADAFYLSDATLSNGVVYYDVTANRLTFANYNAGGIIRFETNGGTDAGTIDAAQNLSIPGTITGSSIIKSGGLSTQFLKADGSTSTLTNPITGTGTTGALSLFTGSTSIGDSLITQSASVLTAAAKTLISNTFTGISLLNPLGLSVGTNNTFDASITWPSLEPCDNVEFLQNNNYNGNITYGNGSYTANHLILSSFQFLVASITITSTQTTGIRALANQILQARINGTNNGTITHFANSLVYGDFAASTARFIFTNRYGYLVNDLDEYGAGHTYTNRYAFYNQGANDHNHFAGKMLLNTLTVTSDQLSVVGTTNLNGALTGTSATFSSSVTATSLIKSGGTSAQYLMADGSTSTLTNPVTGTGTTNFLPKFTGASTIGNSNLINDSSGNLGLGVTPSAWGAAFKAIQIGSRTCLFTESDLAVVLSNNYVFTDTRRYLVSDFATQYNQVFGQHQWFNAPSGTAGNAITFTQAMTLNASGNLSIGNTNDTFKLDVSGTLRVVGAATFSSTVYTGASSINASAQLEADSTTKGFLPPRMTTTQKNAIAAPAAGLLIYDSTLNKLCVRTAAAWETITSV